VADQFNILDYTDGPLLKTGQTTVFIPAGRTTKDDGGFQRGINGSFNNAQYNILTTGQYSGTVNITVNTIVDIHSNECVHDKVTGLIWNRTASSAIYGTGAEGLMWEDAVNSEDFFEYCDQANLSILSGFSDWRIPNAKELWSLIISESTIATPLVNNTAFPVWSSILGTSSTRADDTTRNIRVNFSVPNISSAVKTLRQITTLVRLGIN